MAKNLNFLGVLRLDTITTYKEFQDIIKALLKASTLEVRIDPTAKHISPAYAGWQTILLQKIEIPTQALLFKITKRAFDDFKDFQDLQINMMRLLHKQRNRLFFYENGLTLVEAQVCPNCGAELPQNAGSLHFLSTEKPEFIVCTKCNTALDPETLQPLAYVIA
jgi:hypothetical protein